MTLRPIHRLVALVLAASLVANPATVMGCVGAGLVPARDGMSAIHNDSARHFGPAQGRPLQSVFTSQALAFRSGDPLRGPWNVKRAWSALAAHGDLSPVRLRERTRQVIRRVRLLKRVSRALLSPKTRTRLMKSQLRVKIQRDGVYLGQDRARRLQGILNAANDRELAVIGTYHLQLKLEPLAQIMSCNPWIALGIALHLGSPLAAGWAILWIIQRPGVAVWRLWRSQVPFKWLYCVTSIVPFPFNLLLSPLPLMSNVKAMVWYLVQSDLRRQAEFWKNASRICWRTVKGAA